MKVSLLLERMFCDERWQEMIDKADEKGIDVSIVRKLCEPKERKKLMISIILGTYRIAPPHIAKIPKDTPGEFREVYVNDGMDRIVLCAINDTLFELFGDMIHPKSRAYQKGLGTQDTVKHISHEIGRLRGVKADLSKYFDNVKIEFIDAILDKIEEILEFEIKTEPVINLIRAYYHQDEYYDLSKNLCSRYQGLKQGCAIASFLANVVLYDMDEFMSNQYKVYYRYSDDIVVMDENIDDVIDDMNRFITPKGITLNPKKVEMLDQHHWFKFLGFNIKGSQITLSASRIKKFQNEIMARSINRKKHDRKNFNGQKAWNLIKRYLYEGDYCWATSCLGTMNVEKDIIAMDMFVQCCIRACDTGKMKHIHGLGIVNGDDYTIDFDIRGQALTNLKKQKELQDYTTMLCMSNNLKIGKAVFEAVVRNMKGGH